MASLGDRILALIQTSPGLTDREITDLLVGKAAPQQHVNQTCNRLHRRGLLLRRRRPDTKIGNYPGGRADSLLTEDRAVPPNASVHAPAKIPHQPVTATQLADWRRRLLRLLDAIDPAADRPQGEGLAGRIARLSKAGKIPRHIAACMRTVSESRNVTEYEAAELSVAESAAVEASWGAVKEWASKRGLKL